MHLFPAPRRPRRACTRFLPALCLGLILAAPAVSASPALHFHEAIARAGRAAPTLEARSAELTAARELAAQADQLPDPELILGIENLPVGAGPFGSSDSDMTMKKVGLMQAFPAPAKRRARRAVADSLVDRAQALSAIELLEVREQVASAWLAAWTAQRELAALQALREQAALAVRLAEARLRGGTGTAVEAMATKAAALEVENRLEAVRADLAAARAGLAGWLGVDPAALGSLGEAPDLAALPVSEAVLLATAGTQRRLIDWRSREVVAEARVEEALAEKRPDWSLMAAYGQRDDGLDDMLMVEVRIGLPLFAGNRQDRQVAARRAELQAASAERREAERAQLEAVRRALARWQGLRAQIRRQEAQILPLARDRSEAALAAYGAGAALQPWLEARRDELEARLAHARTLGELASTWASLAYLATTEADR